MHIVYTDGSFAAGCKGEPNAGWACVIKDRTQVDVTYDHGRLETAASAELEAVLMALNATKDFKHVLVKCDSKYLVDNIKKGIEERAVGRSFKEKLEGKITRDHKRLHKILDIVEKRKSQKKITQFEWVKGHSDNDLNIIADSLAWIARTKPQRRRFTHSKNPLYTKWVIEV